MLKTVLLSLSMVAVAGTAHAAGCKVNIGVDNRSNDRAVCLHLKSKTRANPRWVSMNNNIATMGDRKICAGPGKSVSKPINFPLVGCKVKRALQAEIVCHKVGKRPGFPVARRTGERHVENVGFHKLKDRKFRYKCEQ